MNKTGIILIGLLLPGFISGNAQNFKVTEDSAGYLVEITVDGLLFGKDNTHDSIPVVKDATGIYEQGAPELPKYAHAFQLPSLEGYQWQVVEDKWADVPAAVSPSLGFVYQNKDPGTRIKGVVYSRDAFYPEDQARLFPVHTIKKKSEQVIWFFPLQYNPQKHLLRVHSFLKIRLTAPGVPVYSLKSLKTGTAFSPEKMLIVVPDSFRLTLLPFIQWKNQKGIEVLLLSSDSLVSAQNIKTAVKNYYTTQSISSLLLVGDNNQTPTISSIYGPSDYSYGLIEGNDYYIDIGVGRFPARSKADLTNMIDKTIAYEKATIPGEWIKTFGGLASNASGSNGGDNGESDLEHTVKIAQLFSSHSFLPKIIYEGGTNNVPVSSLVNKGCGYLFYIGHGSQTAWVSTPFNNDSVAKLSNHGMYPFIVDGACLNGDLTYPVCLAEKFMSASNNNGATGSVAMLSSTISQLWAPPMLGQDVIAQSLFSPVNGEINTTLGEICNQGFHAIINTYNSGGIETAYTWMLYGDPSLKLWSKTPATIDVTLPNVFDVAKDTFTVSGPDSAIVTIMSNGVLLDAAMIVSGKAHLMKGGAVISDSVVVTVSKQNCIPNIVKLAPYSDGSSYYNINSIIVSDDNDGLPEYGEWVEVRSVVTNYGLHEGKNVKVEVYLHDSNVEIMPFNISVDAINSKVTDTLQGIKIRAIRPLPDGYTAKIGLKVTDLSGQVNAREFTITFFAPIINTTDILVNGQHVSEGNISVMKDTVSVSLIVSNTGHATSSNLKAKLMSEDMMIHYLSDTSYIFSIKPQHTDTLHYTLLVDKNCQPGWLFKGQISIDETSADPLLFSFYYKTIPQITLGDGQATENEFPFYNYYKANRTQIIYRSNEMGNAPILIDSIGFNLASVPFDTKKRIFSNFKISVGEVSSTSFNNSFISSDSLTQVFYQSSYNMPNQTGWFTADVSDYLYSGHKNLLVEIVWGINTVNTGYNDSYAVVAHISSAKSTGYGYNDFTTPSPWTNSSNARPDIRFSGKLSQLNKVYLSYKDKSTSLSYQTVYVKIGEKWLSIALNDSTSINLPNGEYSYIVSAEKDGPAIQNGEFEVKTNNQVIPIILPITTIRSTTNNQLVVYPNPTRKEATVKFATGTSHAVITVRNLNGQIVYQSSHVNSEEVIIDFSLLSAGSYIIEVRNNEIVQRTMLMKE